MDISPLQVFEEIYLSRIAFPGAFPENLATAGFAETDRKHSTDETGTRTTRLLFQKPDSPHAFSLLLNADGRVSDGALILPDTPANRADLLAYIQSRPGLIETTEETRLFFAWAPEDISWTLVDTRFWTSKEIGQTGINLSLGPALLPFADGSTGIALSANPNFALQDPLTDTLLAELTGPGSRLQKFILIFSEIATKACPDIDKILCAAKAYGYEGIPEEDGSICLNGGAGPNPRSEDITSSIYINRETDYAFECALTFKLDERLSGDAIRGALFSHLGLTPSPQDASSAKLDIGGTPYHVRHQILSGIYGDHAFLLQR